MFHSHLVSLIVKIKAINLKKSEYFKYYSHIYLRIMVKILNFLNLTMLVKHHYTISQKILFILKDNFEMICLRLFIQFIGVMHCFLILISNIFIINPIILLINRIYSIIHFLLKLIFKLGY